MISFLEGKIIELEPTFLVLAVGGVGYLLKISLNTFSALNGKKESLLQTYMHYSQTEGQTLYGFSDALERKLFLHLIAVNGVGPGTALVALSSATAADLIQAISSGDTRRIQSLKGIGPKTAQRIILELRDKLVKELGQASVSLSGVALADTGTNYDDALSALVTLGIPKATAEKTLSSIIKTSEKSLSTEELIRMALNRGS